MTPVEKENELRSLFAQWADGAGDEQTLRRLADYAGDSEMRDTWHQLLENVDAGQPSPISEERQLLVIDAVYNKLSAAIPELGRRKPVRRLRPWRKYAAAACLAALMATAGYFIFSAGNRQQRSSQPTVAFNVIPGNTNKAILTLGNGTSIVLDSAANGRLTDQEGATVTKPEDGYVTYLKDDTAHGSVHLTAYNTIRTPGGGTYKIVLSDGTGVWLNAASTLTFPVVFTGTERTVTISGEAYFEVAKNARMPFRVNAHGAVIEVLGTHFNISAYSDDPLNHTTLLEGKIRLVKGGKSVVLKPGQQARYSEDGGAISIIEQVGADEAIAWKNGSFNFNNQDLVTVMNQISRWYNVNVKYEGRKPDVSILGMMNRNTDLATVLKSLELTSGIHFTLEKGSIIIRQ